MPHPKARGTFYAGFLGIMAINYGVLAGTWWASPTPGRAAGVDWVAGWMTTNTVAVLWGVAAVACLGGAVFSARRTRRRLVLACGTVAALVPLLIAAYFFGASLIWYLDPTPGHPPPGHPPHRWYEKGSPQAWVTGTAYLCWSLIGMWALMVHTGTTVMISRVVRAVWGRITGVTDRSEV